MKHTRALTYSRAERLHFRIFGRWPRAVVERRLDALFMDELEAKAARMQDRTLKGGRL